MTDKLVILHRFDNSYEANLIKSILDSHDIYSVLIDENVSTINPYYTSAIGLIKLQVKESELDLAVSVLKENNFDFKIYDKDDNIGAPPCPQCDSRKVYSKPMSLGFILLGILFLFVPLLARPKEWRCTQCHYTWKETLSFGKIFFSLLLALILLGIINAFYNAIVN